MPYIGLMQQYVPRAVLAGCAVATNKPQRRMFYIRKMKKCTSAVRSFFFFEAQLYQAACDDFKVHVVVV